MMTKGNRALHDIEAAVQALLRGEESSVRVWITADTHSDHNLLVVNGDRPMGFTQIYLRRHNELVADNDVVLHLGDVSFGTEEQGERFIKRLKGRIVLVKGNHDRRNPSWYLARGVLAIVNNLQVDGILFTHRPIEQLPDDVMLNVHAHLHSKFREQQHPYAIPPHYHHVDIDQTLAPFTLAQVLDILVGQGDGKAE